MNDSRKLVEIVDNRDIIFKALGGVSEVGATSYFVKWKGTKILIDAGKRQNGVKETPEYDEIDRDIDIFFITHVHQDHVGSLMEYFDYFNFGKIITTLETRDVLKTILLDSRKILTKNISTDLKKSLSKANTHLTEEENEKLKKSSGVKVFNDLINKYDHKLKTRNTTQMELLKLYDEKVIDRFISTIEIKKYNDKIAYKNLNYTLLNTSHLIGSCGLFFEDFNYRLFITSDFTESQKFFHPHTNFEPVYGKEIDTMITETTYGSTEESSEILKDTTLSDLENKINTIFSSSEESVKGGNILIPAFAIGRTQEIILAILLLIKDNRIPLTTKILVPFNLNAKFKNLSHNLTERYYDKYKSILEEELEEKINLSFDEFVKKYLKTINLRDDSVFFDNQNQILIGTPGMLGGYIEKAGNGGDAPFGIIKIALNIFSSKRHGIIFAGYQAPGTLGGRIQGAAYGDEFMFMSNNCKRNTPHIYKVSFPGHVSAKGILDLTKKVKPTNLILTHGDIHSSITVAKAIKDRNIDVIIPDIEEDIYLMDNNRKRFFSTHHKYSNIILSLDDLGEMGKIDYDKIDIINNPGFDRFKIIKAVKDVFKYDPKINHFNIVIFKNEKNIQFYEKLEKELNCKGYSSDLVKIDNSDIELKENKLYLFREILEFISEKALGFKEKFRIYALYNDLFYSYPFFLISQILDEEMFIVNENNNVVNIPTLPIDVDVLNFKYFSDLRRYKKENEETIYLEEGHLENAVSSDFYELIDRIMKYKKTTKKRNNLISESIPNQLPKYEKNNILFRKDLFALNNISLWGNIETVYDVKNNVAVKILTEITKKLNEDIKQIQFTNYITNYDNHKYYGEIIGFEKEIIFYKMVLENGIQYLTIKLSFKVDVEQSINKIGLKYEA